MNVMEDTWSVYAAVNQYTSRKRERRNKRIAEISAVVEKNEADHDYIVHYYNEFLREQIGYHSGLYEHLSKSIDELDAAEKLAHSITGCPDVLYAMLGRIRDFINKCSRCQALAEASASALSKTKSGVAASLSDAELERLVLSVFLYYGVGAAEKAVRHLTKCGTSGPCGWTAIDLVASQSVEQFDLSLSEAILLLGGPYKTESSKSSSLLALARRNLHDRKTVQETQVIRCVINTVFKQSLFHRSGIRRLQAQILSLKNKLRVQREILMQSQCQNRDFREMSLEEQQQLAGMVKTALALVKKFPLSVEVGSS